MGVNSQPSSYSWMKCVMNEFAIFSQNHVAIFHKIEYNSSLDHSLGISLTKLEYYTSITVKNESNHI